MSLARTLTPNMTLRKSVLLLQAGKPPRQAKLILTTTTRMVVEGRNVRKGSPVRPEKMATPILMTMKQVVAERKSAGTRKEKSFPVPPPAPEKKATPILTTRTVTGKSAYPNQASPVPLEKAEQAKKAT